MKLIIVYNHKFLYWLQISTLLLFNVKPLNIAMPKILAILHYIFFTRSIKRQYDYQYKKLMIIFQTRIV